MVNRARNPDADHAAEVAAFVRDMEGRDDFAGNPPAFRMLWSIGSKVPPPYFLSWPAGAAISAVTYGLPFGLVLWVYSWVDPRLTLANLLVIAPVGGVLFGVYQATSWRLANKRYSLGTWASYRISRSRVEGE